MRYETEVSHAKIIDFPGEYDVDGISIICFEADKKLSYIFTLGEERVALLQNAAPLEIISFDGIQTWLCMNESIKDEIERLEMEGEIQMISEEE